MIKFLSKKGIEPLIPILLYRLFIVYVLFTLCRLGFYLFNLDFFDNISFSQLLVIFVGGLKFDTVAIFYTNILFIALHVIPFRFRYNKTYQEGLFYIFVITNSIALLANFADFMYYPFTLKRTTFSVFQEFIHENIGGLGLRFLVDYWYLALLYAATVYAMLLAYRRVKVFAYSNNNKLRYYITGTAFMLLTITMFIGGVRGGFKHSTRPITLSNAGDYAAAPNQMHIVLNTPFSIYKTIEIRSLERLNYFADSASLAQVYLPVHNAKARAAFEPMNIMIIIVESLGRENLGFFNADIDSGRYKGYTPFLDSLCAQSLVFWDSYANGRKSIDVLPSILSSIPSIQEPFVLTSYYDNTLPSLPRMLKAKGYHTSFFHGAPNGSMGFSAFTRLAGVDHYYGLNEYGNRNDFDGMWGIWDEPFLQYWCRQAGSFPQPFFSTVFTVSSHHPFKVPEKYEGKFSEGPDPILKTFGYTDFALQKFFETASRQTWFKKTLFVITADHCNSKPVFDEYLNAAGVFAVPIIFYKGDGSLKGIRHELMQQIDIMPTILGLINYDQPFFAFGFDALNDSSRFVVNYLNDVCQIFEGPYMFQFGHAKAIALYNIKTDRLLKKNLLGTLPEIEARMELKAKAFMQQYSNRMIDNKLYP